MNDMFAEEPCPDWVMDALSAAEVPVMRPEGKAKAPLKPAAAAIAVVAAEAAPAEISN